MDYSSQNRWLQWRPIVAVDKVYSTFLLPVFLYDTVGMISGAEDELNPDDEGWWLGSANRVTMFNYEFPNNFVLRGYPALPASRNFVLTIGYREGENITRYKIWTGSENETDPLDDTVSAPYYNGEQIKKNFFLELWSTETNREVSLDSAVLFYTSIKYPVTDINTHTTLTALPVAVECNTQRSILASLPLTGLVANYKASTGVTADGGGNVSQWNDLSGNGHHLTQATALNKPGQITLGDAYGGLAIAFDGTNDYISNTSFNEVSADTPLYFFAVMRSNSFTNNRTYVQIEPGHTELQSTGVNNELRLDVLFTDVVATGFTNTQFKIVRIRLDYLLGLDVDSTLKIDDEAAFDVVGGSSDPEITELYLGCRLDGVAGRFAAMQVAEIAIYKHELTDIELGQLMTYFRQLYRTDTFTFAYPLPMQFPACSVGNDNP